MHAKITSPPPLSPPPAEVTLKMSREEARALRCIMGCNSVAVTDALLESVLTSRLLASIGSGVHTRDGLQRFMGKTYGTLNHVVPQHHDDPYRVGR